MYQLDSAGIYTSQSVITTAFFLSSISAPPYLTADSTDNKVGNPIDITFTDDESRRNAITEIKVGRSLYWIVVMY